MPGSNAERVKWIIAVILVALGGFAGGYKVAPRASIVPGPGPGPSAPAVYVQGPGGCMHFDGSEWVCPGMTDSAISGDRLFLRGDSITIGPISVLYRGTTYQLPVPPHADAIFFTPEAAQILVEHYRATNPAKATELRNLLNGLPRP